MTPMPILTVTHMRTPMMSNDVSPDLSRRGFVVGATAVGLLPLAPRAAAALTTAQAQALVGRLVSELSGIMNSGKSEGAIIRDFERLLGRYGDMPIIAQTILGVPWRSASGGQRRAFTSALQGYLARKYGRQFREFIGLQIEVDRARQVRSFFEVKSTARVPGRSPFELIFLVSDRSGQDKFFNMIVEGINLRTTENTEIGALLDQQRGNMDAMIAELRQRG